MRKLVVWNLMTLKLLESKALKTGALVLRYEPVKAA